MIYLLIINLFSILMEYSLDHQKALEVFQTDLKAVSLYNPLRKSHKIYWAIDLDLFLNKSLSPQNWKQCEYLIFVSMDGYRSKFFIKELDSNQGKNRPYIALDELDSTHKRIGFASFKKGERTINPGPFYLVWTGMKEGMYLSGKEERKWPYQLKKILCSAKK